MDTAALATANSITANMYAKLLPNCTSTDAHLFANQDIRLAVVTSTSQKFVPSLLISVYVQLPLSISSSFSFEYHLPAASIYYLSKPVESLHAIGHFFQHIGPTGSAAQGGE